MIYLYSFMFCGLVCLIGQIILDNTKLTPGHITSLFVVIGSFLDTFNILKEEKIDDIYFHCYSYSYECYLEVLSFFPKAKFGIGGVITFKNSKKLVEVVSKGNMESFLVETDCPYLAPEPFRGKTNDPSLIPYIINKIAEIKNEETEKISEILLNNSKEFYHEQY